MRAIIVVAGGSALGGVLRYGMQGMVNRYYPSAFPFGTFAVNLLGCFVIGLCFALFEKGQLANAELKLLLITGICGGFTTFSSYSLENIQLLRSGHLLYCCLYIAGSVAGGIAATLAGICFARVL